MLCKAHKLTGPEKQMKPEADKTDYNQINRDAVFGNGYTYDNSVSFSYNGERNRTYISISNVDQDGIMKGNSDYTRTSLKLNNTTQATDKLLFKLSY